MTLEFEITTGRIAPIYRQVVDQVRLGVVGGRLEAGEQLPSVRTLAEQLLVNPNTIARAYGELVRDGVLESRHGQGVFVAERRQVYSDEEQARRLEHALDSLLSECAALGCPPDMIRSALDERLKSLGMNDSAKKTTRRKAEGR